MVDLPRRHGDFPVASPKETVVFTTQQVGKLAERKRRMSP